MARSAQDLQTLFQTVLAVPAHRAFGLGLVDWRPGEATLDFTASENCLGPTGDVHGGVVSMLLEPAAVCALLPLLPEDRHAVTVDIHVQLMRRIRPGARVLLKGRALRIGAQLAFCEASAIDDDKVCAHARLTKAIVPAG